MYVLHLLKGFLIVSCKCTLIYLPLYCPVATFDSFWCLFFYSHLHFLVQASASYTFLITRLIFTLGSTETISLSGFCFIVPSVSFLWVPKTTAHSKAQQALKSLFRQCFSFTFVGLRYWLHVHISVPICMPVIGWKYKTDSELLAP